MCWSSLASVRIEDQGAVRVLTLSNPKKKNAVDDAILRALLDALQPESSVRALLLRGEGDAFCSGYDLGDLKDAAGDLPDSLVGQVMEALDAHAAPSVALVQGPAFGAGCDLAVACDFRVGAPSAVFCMPPAKLGLLYSPSGMARFREVVGGPRANRMFLTAKKVPAAEAQAWGLLDELGADEDDAVGKAMALCDELTSLAPLSVQGGKAIFRALRGTTPIAELDAAFLDRRRTAFRSEDAREGRTAFAAKRKPDFHGR